MRAAVYHGPGDVRVEDREKPTIVEPTALPATLEKMERHRFSSQTFLPLDASRYLVCVALIAVWVLAVTWATKRRWLRWLSHELADEVSSKMDAIRRAAPFN